MEKETKRALQRLIEIVQEQQKAIRILQTNVTPSTSALHDHDGLTDRLVRIAADIRDRESFEIDWRRMYDLQIATKGTKGGEGAV